MIHIELDGKELLICGFLLLAFLPQLHLLFIFLVMDLDELITKPTIFLNKLLRF